MISRSDFPLLERGKYMSLVWYMLFVHTRRELVDSMTQAVFCHNIILLLRLT